MLSDLKEAVFKANQDLVKTGLVIMTFGNVSGIERRRGIVAIKPSGVPYDSLKADDIVLVDLEGRVVEGWLNLAGGNVGLPRASGDHARSQ